MGYEGTPIMGKSSAQLSQMEEATFAVNSLAPRIAEFYLLCGKTIGVRGDVAYAQALLETNYFRFGGVAQAQQNNYGGIGVTGPGQPGASFATPQEGVLAHLQHLYAYATTAALPPQMAKVDPRFDLVDRGSAPYVGNLNGRWAVPGTNYGQTIDRILSDILMVPVPGEPYQITQRYLDVDGQNRPGSCTASECWQGVEGIVIHRTASPSMNAQAIRDYFNTAPDGRYASSQFVVDDHEILRLMPIGEIAYHTIGKNLGYLGIETCEYNWGSETWPETYKRLVWLTAYLVRAFQLRISDVTGHFWWDPVNRPYDPTYMGWLPSNGQATGIFEWNQFIADVLAQTSELATREPAPAETVDVAVTKVVQEACTQGLLINSTTYVPIRSYTECLMPNANIRWVDSEKRVVVELPATTAAAQARSGMSVSQSAVPQPAGTAASSGTAERPRIQLPPNPSPRGSQIPVWAVNREARGRAESQQRTSRCS